MKHLDSGFDSIIEYGDTVKLSVADAYANLPIEFFNRYDGDMTTPLRYSYGLMPNVTHKFRYLATYTMVDGKENPYKHICLIEDMDDSMSHRFFVDDYNLLKYDDSDDSCPFDKVGE